MLACQGLSVLLVNMNHRYSVDMVRRSEWLLGAGCSPGGRSKTLVIARQTATGTIDPLRIGMVRPHQE